MSLTISNSRSIFQQPLSQPLPKSDAAQNPPSFSATSVTLSDEAQTLLKQEQTANKPELSKAELRALYHRVEGPNPWSNKLNREMNELGKSAPSLMEMPPTLDPERLALAKQAAKFVYSFHTRGPAETPYKGLSREALNEIIYDESGEHTSVERRAAQLTRNSNDQVFFIGLGNQPDQRVFFKGAVDYFDALSPVEQSIYPEGHRETWQRLLEQEEAQSGKLRSGTNPLELMMNQSPTHKWDLLSYHINEGPAGFSTEFERGSR